MLARCLALDKTSIQEMQALAHAWLKALPRAAARVFRERAHARGWELQACAADVRDGGVQLTRDPVPQPLVQLAPGIPDAALALDAAMSDAAAAEKRKRKADAVAAPGAGGKVEGQLESRQTQAVQASAAFKFSAFRRWVL
jgi:hypothetical protein